MRILLTQGRSTIALEMARHLHASGHTVCVVDTLSHTVCRYSAAVWRAYVVAEPRVETQTFLRDVRRIVEQDGIDRIIPVFEEAMYLAQDASLRSLVFAASLAQLDVLHNKHSFAQVAGAAGLRVAETTLVTCGKDLAYLDRRYVYAIKPCYARAAQALIKWTPQMSEAAVTPHLHSAFVAQRWIDGRRFCSYSVCEAGRVQAHVVYPVDYTVDGHSCVYFTAVEHPGIDTWVCTLVRKLKLRGQFAFDFIVTGDGHVYAIECNPRATSGVHLFRREARLSAALTGKTYYPVRDYVRPTASRQIALGMLLYAWRQPGRGQRSFWRYLCDIARTADVVFDTRDLGPWLAQPLAFWDLWRTSRRLGLPIPDAFLSDFEWHPPVPKAPQLSPPLRPLRPVCLSVAP